MSDPQTTEPCSICGGQGVVPIFRYAVPLGGPDELPCPFCRPKETNHE